MLTKWSEKHNLKLICQFIYHLGLADCWYEKREIRYPMVNRLLSIIANIFSVIFVFNDLAAYFRTDLTYREKNDLLTFNFGYIAITLKAVLIYLKRKGIRVFFKNLLDNVQDLDGRAERSAILLHVPFFFALTSASVQFFVAIKDYYEEGIPIRVEVLFYPKASDTGIFANFVRFLALAHFWYMICIMISINYLCLCSLVSVKYKFTKVRVHFENLRKTPKNSEQLEGFLAGVELHKYALWCARNVQNTIGSISSVQIFESLSLLTVCLLRAIYVESDTMLLLACLSSYFFFVAQTGLYMTYSADITFEAQQIPTAIFHSGWETVQGRPALRKLIVVTLQQCQKPVYLTAFGFINLSYANFITILRSSYSFFVVMRDFNK